MLAANKLIISSFPGEEKHLTAGSNVGGFFNALPPSIANILLTQQGYNLSRTDGLGRVDNILKMLLGVLSVAGAIALVIPQKNPIPQSSLAARAEMDAAPVPAPLSQSPPAEMPKQFDSEPPSSFQIGEPAIDGYPLQADFGMPFGVSAQTSSSKGDVSQSSRGGFTPPAYTMPGSAPPEPEAEEQNAELTAGPVANPDQ